MSDDNNKMNPVGMFLGLEDDDHQRFMSSGRLILAIYELPAFQAVFRNITSSCSLTSLWLI